MRRSRTIKTIVLKLFNTPSFFSFCQLIDRGSSSPDLGGLTFVERYCTYIKIDAWVIWGFFYHRTMVHFSVRRFHDRHA